MKGVVLLSGGLDSTTVLAIAQREGIALEEVLKIVSPFLAH